MDKKIPCNVIVGTEAFSLNVDKAEEEIVRKAAKLINEKILHYRATAQITSTQRLLALSALDFVMSNLKFDLEHDTLEETVIERVSVLEKVLDSIEQ
jgi:cell division protein ZapA